MRNSTVRHNHGTGYTLMLLLAALPTVAAEPFRVGSEDVVVLRADSAWEDVIPETVRFSGAFEMRVLDLRLTADRATVRGPLENPDAVELEGAPARLHMQRPGTTGPQAIEAEGQRIVYQREPRQIRIDGGARLSEGAQVLRSSHIEYDPVTDRVRAAGNTGVQIDVQGAN